MTATMILARLETVDSLISAHDDKGLDLFNEERSSLAQERYHLRKRLERTQEYQQLAWNDAVERVQAFYAQ